MPRIRAKIEFETPHPSRLLRRVRALMRPRRRALATDGGWDEPNEARIAPRNAGWAELFTADGATRMGRGHLLIWPAEPGPGEGEGVAEVDKDSGLALGGGAPPLRGQLRSFTVDAGPPVPGDSLAVRPENETQLYPVVVKSFEAGDGEIVELDWPDEQLPAALSELGGN